MKMIQDELKAMGKRWRQSNLQIKRIRNKQPGVWIHMSGCILEQRQYLEGREHKNEGIVIIGGHDRMVRQYGNNL